MTDPVTGRRTHRGTPVGDDGSMVIAMLLIMVGTMLSGLLMPMVVTSLSTTRVDVRRVGSLAAAQTGLDVAVGQIRGSVDDTGAGILSGLPCANLTGTVSAAGTGRYDVSLRYYGTDPVGQSDSWLVANKLRCIAGGGTPSTPSFALLESRGTTEMTGAISSVPGRVLRATYNFQTNNANIDGGQIHVYQTATSTDMCMDAGADAPAAGSNLQMQPCGVDDSQQTFAYNLNLTIVLASSRTAATPLGMCLDAGSPHVSGALVQFKACTAVTVPQQQWSLNDSANFEGTTDGSSLNGFCFNVQNPNVAGSFVILATTVGGHCRGAYDNIQTFQPDAAVGAGAAGPLNKQLVDFAEFGRCLDVTEQNVNYSYVIVWPCKQAPNPANVTWNQKWTVPVIPDGDTSVTGQIVTNPSSGAYCLLSPGSPATGNYVKTVPCSSGSADAKAWTLTGATGVYATSYRIVDHWGFCLAPTDPDATPADLYPKGLRISKVVVAVCTESTLQKWNAPANILSATPLTNLGEK